MLLTKRAPVSDVFTYKKNASSGSKIEITKSSHEARNTQYCSNDKNNILKALLCVSLLKANCSIMPEQ